MPCLGLALFFLLVGIYMNLYTDCFIYGHYIRNVSAFYIIVYINYIHSEFRNDYPYLYWALTFVCIIFFNFSPNDIFGWYNRVVEWLNGIVKMWNS